MSLRENGWEKIIPGASLQAAIEAMFFDICNYVLLLVEDSDIGINVDQLEEAVTNRDVAEAERELQLVMLGMGKKDRKLLGKVYDLGTRPMKLLSGMAIFFDPQIQSIINDFFRNTQPILVKPYNGETLHLFPPGAENFKYNLPIHQDFPYLLQSEKQLTFWLNLTENQDRNAGKIRIYPGTHVHGVPKTTKNPAGHYEVVTSEYPQVDLANYHDSDSSLFEMYAVDSLTWHSSIPNTSTDSTRITYIFRISDIDSIGRVQFGADRAMPGSKAFEDFYPELYIAPSHAS